MKDTQSFVRRIVKLVALALGMWLFEAVCPGFRAADAQSASFAWLSTGVDDDGGLSAGFGGGVFLNRLFLGGAGDVRFPESTAPSDVLRHAGAGRVLAGVALLHRGRLMIFPTVGLGIAGSSVRSMPGDTGTREHDAFGVVTFELRGDVRSLSSLGPLVGFSLGARRSFAHEDASPGGANRIDPGRDAVYLGIRIGWGAARTR